MRIVALHQKDDTPARLLTPALRRLYAGELSFPLRDDGRPYVIGNFVETIDGVVSFRIKGRSGGSEISGGSAEDRFIMGLLRSLSDAVLVGSGTLHGDPGHIRTPEFIYPEAKDLYTELRAKLGKRPMPLNVVLTASGNVNIDEPTFHTDGLTAVIITTKQGMSRLVSDHAGKLSSIVVRSIGESGLTTPEAVLHLLADEFGVRLLLHEGGPTIFGQFLRAKAIDELFLTLAPQIAGRRSAGWRPGIAGEMLFAPETAPWLKLRSVRRGSDHLFLRYAAAAG